MSLAFDRRSELFTVAHILHASPLCEQRYQTHTFDGPMLIRESESDIQTPKHTRARSIGHIDCDGRRRVRGWAFRGMLLSRQRRDARAVELAGWRQRAISREHEQTKKPTDSHMQTSLILMGFCV